MILLVLLSVFFVKPLLGHDIFSDRVTSSISLWIRQNNYGFKLIFDIFVKTTLSSINRFDFGDPVHQVKRNFHRDHQVHQTKQDTDDVQNVIVSWLVFFFAESIYFILEYQPSHCIHDWKRTLKHWHFFVNRRVECFWQCVIVQYQISTIINVHYFSI